VAALARPLQFPTLRAGAGRRASRADGSATPAAEACPPAGLSPAEAAILKERARAEGFEAGRREGHAAAYAEAAGELRAAVAALEGASRTLLGARVRLAAEIDHQLPKLVLALARKIIHQELAEPNTALQTAIRGLTERLAGCERPVVVRLCPAALEMSDEWRRSPEGERALGPGVRFEADATLGAGEWVVQTGDGFLDGRVESQLEEAWRVVGELPR
jgi:flagellar assembly protein FliH